MIDPIGASGLDNRYLLPTTYLYGYGIPVRRAVGSRPAIDVTPRREIQDVVTLSPAAKRILEQAERLAAMANSSKQISARSDQ